MAAITSRKNNDDIAPSAKIDKNPTVRKLSKLAIRLQFPIAMINSIAKIISFFLDFIIVSCWLVV